MANVKLERMPVSHDCLGHLPFELQLELGTFEVDDWKTGELGNWGAGELENWRTGREISGLRSDQVATTRTEDYGG